MQKVFFLLTILLIVACAPDKKRNTNTTSEHTNVTDTSITYIDVKDAVVNDTRSNNQEIKDSILATGELEAPKKEIVNTKNVLKKTTPLKEVIKEKEIKSDIKKMLPDHSDWNYLTKKYVSSSGKVNYKGFKTEISKVEAYLDHLKLTSVQKDWTKNEKLAYWFNLYNAATIYLVTTHYPIQSIKDINGGKPWDKKFIKSGDKIYSLNQIENTIVRPNFDEPRLHVAFNCAAISCPKLLNEAFTPTKLTTQLNQLATSWINDATKNKITNNSLEISKIFEWYVVDFKKGVIPFINQYAITKVQEPAKIQYLKYNWELND
ncbi:DUF547 domain-containing protein [Aquimarina sp. M1]